MVYHPDPNEVYAGNGCIKCGRFRIFDAQMRTHGIGLCTQARYREPECRVCHQKFSELIASAATTDGKKAKRKRRPWPAIDIYRHIMAHKRGGKP